MINFMIAHYLGALRIVQQEIAVGVHKMQTEGQQAVLDDRDKERISNNLKYVTKKADDLGLPMVHARVERIYTKLRIEPIIAAADMANEMNVLLESFEDDVRFLYLYAYPREKVKWFVGCQAEWQAAIAAFPSALAEIKAATDLYALGHNPACVFHTMRVAELGMRALARERQVVFPKHPLEWAEWQNVIDQIEIQAKAATASMSRGPEKDAAQGFYTAAVAQLRAFKETRNRIMHMRGDFDELDAQRAMGQVRDFMNGLSAKIDDKTRRPIRKWP